MYKQSYTLLYLLINFEIKKGRDKNRMESWIPDVGIYYSRAVAAVVYDRAIGCILHIFNRL